MNTNYQMLLALEREYEPEKFGIINKKELDLIKEKLHIEEMDILQLRNLRDFTVMFYSRKDKLDLKMSDKMSAITYVIDSRIFDLGGEV